MEPTTRRSTGFPGHGTDAPALHTTIPGLYADTSGLHADATPFHSDATPVHADTTPLHADIPDSAETFPAIHVDSPGHPGGTTPRRYGERAVHVDELRRGHW